MSETDTITSRQVVEPDSAPASERAEWTKFLRISAVYVAGLAAVLFLTDRFTGVFLNKTGRHDGIAADVQHAVDLAQHPHQSARIVVLGDSVARQLFLFNTEPSSDVRYLTTNQAITMAGQYYLATDMIRRSPRLTDIYLIQLPAALENNMPRAYTHDYFCGHFHTLPEVVEVFAVKRDIELSAAHFGRFLLPNLMSANSLTQPATAVDAKPPVVNQTGEGLPPADPERWLTELSNRIGPAPRAIPPAPAGTRVVHLSPISEYFLEQLKNECRQRGIRLHMLASPVSSKANGFRYIDPQLIYDRPMIDDIPPNELVDGIHFKPAYVAAARKRFIEFYGLDFAARK